MSHGFANNPTASLVLGEVHELRDENAALRRQIATLKAQRDDAREVRDEFMEKHKQKSLALIDAETAVKVRDEHIRWMRVHFADIRAAFNALTGQNPERSYGGGNVKYLYEVLHAGLNYTKNGETWMESSTDNILAPYRTVFQRLQTYAEENGQKSIRGYANRVQEYIDRVDPKGEGEYTHMSAISALIAIAMSHRETDQRAGDGTGTHTNERYDAAIDFLKQAKNILARLQQSKNGVLAEKLKEKFERRKLHKESVAWLENYANYIELHLEDKKVLKALAQGLREKHKIIHELTFVDPVDHG